MLKKSLIRRFEDMNIRLKSSEVFQHQIDQEYSQTACWLLMIDPANPQKLQ